MPSATINKYLMRVWEQNFEINTPLLESRDNMSVNVTRDVVRGDALTHPKNICCFIKPIPCVRCLFSQNSQKTGKKTQNSAQQYNVLRISKLKKAFQARLAERIRNLNASWACVRVCVQRNIFVLWTSREPAAPG